MASLKLSSAEGTHWPNLQTILMIEKSSVHDHTNVDFCKRMGVCWVEVANETVSSPEAVRAICQALALSVERLTRRGPGATKNFLDSYPQNETVVPLTHPAGEDAESVIECLQR